MRTSMKFIFYFTAITFFSSLTYADDTNQQIHKACLRHAISLVAQLKNDVLDYMTQEQSDQTLKIATESCQTYFNKDFTETVVSNDDINDEDSDWLTDKIINGDVERKSGNKRLMKKH